MGCVQNDMIPVVCKPDLYYTMPPSWPKCLAKCPAAKPIPANTTRLLLDINNKCMKGEPSVLVKCCVAKPIPANTTHLLLDINSKFIKGSLQFWSSCSWPNPSYHQHMLAPEHYQQVQIGYRVSFPFWPVTSGKAWPHASTNILASGHLQQEHERWHIHSGEEF